MANPAKPKPLDSGAHLEEPNQAQENRTGIRLLGIAAFGLLVIVSHPIGITAKHNPLAALAFLICAACVSSAIVRPRRTTAIMAVGGLLIWFMLPFAEP